MTGSAGVLRLTSYPRSTGGSVAVCRDLPARLKGENSGAAFCPRAAPDREKQQ